MLQYFLKQKWILVIIIGLMFIEPSLTSWMNFYIQDMFNYANNGGTFLMIARMITIIFIAWILKRFIVFTIEALRIRFVCAVRQEIKHTMLKKMFKMDVSKLLENTNNGDYISLFTNDITILEERFFKHIVNLVSNSISIVVLSAAFLKLNVTLAVYIIFFGIISMFVPVIFSNVLNQSNFAYSQKLAELTQRTKEFFSAYPTIKNYAVEDIVEEQFAAVNRSTEEAKQESEYKLSIANNIGSLLSWFMQFVAVGIGLIMVTNEEILIGTVIAAQAFANDLATPLQVVIGNVNSIRSMKKIVDKFTDYTNEDVKDNGVEQRNEEAEPIDVFFDNVNCMLDNVKILDDFTFNFEASKKYLIVGKNGSGKSTLFRVLKKYQQGIEGDILLNGISYSQMNSKELADKVSYLNENVSIFSGRIKDNITLFRYFDEEKINSVVGKTRLKLDLSRNISDSCSDISSGERRRIEIARSLLTNASVLIFDEVISTLDIEAAYEIENMVLSYDKTIIFVSHNFSGKLIRKYDEILIMDNGKLIDHGHYDDLIKRCKYFKKLCAIKFGNLI